MCYFNDLFVGWGFVQFHDYWWEVILLRILAIQRLNCLDWDLLLLLWSLWLIGGFLGWFVFNCNRFNRFGFQIFDQLINFRDFDCLDSLNLFMYFSIRLFLLDFNNVMSFMSSSLTFDNFLFRSNLLLWLLDHLHWINRRY